VARRGAAGVEEGSSEEGSSEEEGEEPPLVRSKSSRFTTDFEVLERLGKGGFGQVRRVRNRRLSTASLHTSSCE